MIELERWGTQLKRGVLGPSDLEAFLKFAYENWPEIIAGLKKTDVQELCSRVASELPVGWALSIDLEHECGSVELINFDGDVEEFPTNYGSLAQQVLDALEHAVNAPTE